MKIFNTPLENLNPPENPYPPQKSQDLDPSTPMRKSQFMKNFEPWENLNPSTAIKLNHPENISPPSPRKKFHYSRMKSAKGNNPLPKQSQPLVKFFNHSKKSQLLQKNINPLKNFKPSPPLPWQFLTPSWIFLITGPPWNFSTPGPPHSESFQPFRNFPQSHKNFSIPSV